jgi:hypothetical protein
LLPQYIPESYSKVNYCCSSRWPFRSEEEDILSVTSPAGSLGTEHNMPSNNTEEAEIPALIMK